MIFFTCFYTLLSFNNRSKNANTKYKVLEMIFSLLNPIIIGDNNLSDWLSFNSLYFIDFFLDKQINLQPETMIVINDVRFTDNLITQYIFQG